MESMWRKGACGDVTLRYKLQDMEFRRLIAKDAESFFANRLRALALSPSAFLSTLEEERTQGAGRFLETLASESPDRVIFGGFDEGALIGTVGIYRETREKIRHKAMLWGMFVEPEYRSKGVGGRLVDLAIRHAREQLNVTGIYLSLESGNHSARRLYESRGFRVWGQEPQAMYDGKNFFDEDHMVLDLSSLR